MVALEVPSGGYKHDLVEYGSEHVPLSGQRTKDIVSVRNEFEIETDGLSPRALSWLRMLYVEAIPGPIYLRESSERNLLRARISSTSSTIANLPGAVDWVIPGVGDAVGAVTAANLTLPCAVPGEEVTMAPYRVLTWTAAGSNRTLADAALIPVLPGEVLCFSAYVQSGTPTLEIVPYNAALVAQAPITGTSIIAGTPPRRYVTYTVPSNGTIVAVQVQLRLAAAGSTFTHAWQLETGTATPRGWQLGLGVPKVMMTGDAQGDRHGIGTYTAGTYQLKEI